MRDVVKYLQEEFYISEEQAIDLYIQGMAYKKPEEIVRYAKYQCLNCDHKDTATGKRKDYKEILVCPKCNGAYVDIWHIAKYKQLI